MNAKSHWRSSLGRGEGEGNMVRSLVAYLDRATQGRGPIERGVQSDESIHLLGNVRRNGRCAAGSHVDMGRQELAGGRERLLVHRVPVPFGHEVHHMKQLVRSGDDPAAKRYLLAGANLALVAEELCQRETAGAGVLEIGMVHPQERKETARGLSKQMRVPHHVHVPHLIEIRFGNRSFVRDGERSQIHAASFSWSKLSNVLPAAASFASSGAGFHHPPCCISNW